MVRSLDLISSTCKEDSETTVRKLLATHVLLLALGQLVNFKSIPRKKNAESAGARKADLEGLYNKAFDSFAERKAADATGMKMDKPVGGCPARSPT